MLTLSPTPSPAVAIGQRALALALEDRCPDRARGALLSELLPILRELGLGLYLHPRHTPRSVRHIISDLDGTLIESEAMVLLARTQGLEQEMQQLTSRAMVGRESFEASFTQRTQMLQGVSLEHLEATVREIPLSLSTLQWLDRMREEGVGVEVASGAYSPVVDSLCRRMDIRHYCASEVEIVDGRLSGQLLRIVGAEEKAAFVRTRLEMLGLSREEVLTIGDGANDLRMLEEGAHALLYQAKLEHEGLSLSEVWDALGALQRGAPQG